MSRCIAIAAVVAAAVAGTTVAAAPVSAAPRTKPSILIVAVHPDDEMTLSAQWTNRPDVQKVFLWLDTTQRGKSRAVDPVTGKPVRWDPGEYNPMDFPGGLSTGYFRGSVSNITAMRAADPSLPRLIYDQPGREFVEQGRRVQAWNNPGRGHGIHYGLTGREVTPTATRAAINDVTTNPAKYGITTSGWVDLISSNYFNRSGVAGSTCDGYANEFHGYANTGVSRWAYPQFTGRKMYAMCPADPGSNRNHSRVAANVRDVAYGPKGTIPKFFGWLYHGRLKTDTTRAGVFSENQWHVEAPAKVGRS